jgi:hypothetical protein
MPFDWRGFLIVAHGLRNDGSEAIQRTSLGRAYYYVYNLGKAHAALNHFSMIQGRGGMHKQLWDWFQNHSDPTIRQMGIDANRMHSLRISADYKDAPIPSIASEVKRQITKAQAFETLMATKNGRTPPADLAP